MDWYYVLLIILGAMLLLFFCGVYVCFKITFYQNPKKHKNKQEFDLPKGKIYLPYRETMTEWIKQARRMNYEEFFTTSFDGLKLGAKYYEYKKGNVTEIMFHGYRGNAERDLCGGIQRAFALGHNVLLVDQRTTGKSQGRVITFGVNERRDCLNWVNFITEKFGKSQKIILTGISMGASTVLMSCSLGLPKNVIGILADCGYSSQKDIIKKCIRQMHLPPDLLYPIIKLGAKLFGKFDPEEVTPLDAIKNTDIPIIYFHGTADDFVPCYMSQRLFDERPQNSKIVTIPNAGHGMSFLVEPQFYISQLKDFFKQ